MKKNVLFRRALTVVSVFALAALVMVGCKKDEVNPDTPNDTIPEEPEIISNFQYGDQTLTINNIIKMDMQGLIAYQFNLNDDYNFTVMGAGEIDSNGVQFTDVMTFFMTGTGIIGMIGTDNEEEEDYVASGSIKVNEKDGRYEIVCKAITEANDSINIYYNGPILDMNKPTGTGKLTVNGTEHALEVGIMGQIDGMYLYELFDTQMSTTLGIESKNALGNSTYTISDDDATVAAGNAVSVDFDIVNLNTEEEIEGELIDGTFTNSISGDTYTFSFSGNSNFGTVTGNFTGSLHDYQIEKAAQKKVNTMLAKMRK